MLQTASWIGPTILIVFACAYTLVFLEEKIHLRKSKPVMAAAGLIWILVALAYQQNGQSHEVAERLRDVLLEYAELFLFLLSAMSFVNTMVERNVFESLRTRLMASQLSVRGIYWITGIVSFFLSPIADNLTTALVMGTVVLSTLGKNKKVAAGALVNVVVAANAGGAFSPFGDITTLMIWQKGVVDFGQFFALFVPALVNWLIPATIIAFTLPKKQSDVTNIIAPVHKGGYVVVGLFLSTIATTVFLDHYMNLPPFLGMMMGLGALNIYGYFLNSAETRMLKKSPTLDVSGTNDGEHWPIRKPFDIFGVLEKVEWDTLLFFYGIMLCVGGVGAIGYLEGLSKFLYTDLGSTTANILIGLLSAIVDNIPLTFAVLTMNPQMDLGQWLLITLTAGVGGSLLSIGSAAGVALMGIGRGIYTFMAHLKWAWAILIGYMGSIVVHIIINNGLFTKQ
ncbi:MAG: sodium:proton antiporter NhaD [Alphaproteobacteria bacterium]|nr:sodium:proton antiporter NhaD [Alphaproteobacteria bacterium]